MTHEFREGTSEPLDMQITPIMADGTTQPSTGINVTLEIVGRGGVVVTTPPTVAWLDQANWKVRISGLESLTAADSPYQMRVELTDAGGKIGHSPTGRYPDVLHVVPY